MINVSKNEHPSNINNMVTDEHTVHINIKPARSIFNTVFMMFITTTSQLKLCIANAIMSSSKSLFL